jgi:hypothetical protein
MAGFFGRARRFVPWLPLGLGTATLASRAISGVLARVGHPAATLDDAYIHFQYARAIAEGHPFRYHAGDPVSTGATSFAWPLVLAPFHALGLREHSIVWAAWALSFLALGALAREAYLLARPLTGAPAAVGAGAMTLLFGGHVFSAASGMEVVPFAWVLALSIRRAAEWTEASADARSLRKLGALGALALGAPLVRPEGAVATLAISAALAISPALGRPRARALALATCLGAFVPALLSLALTGQPITSAAEVKLLAQSPYHDVVTASLANARLLVTSILDGDVWSAEFVPRGGAPFALAGLFALGFRGHMSGRRFRAAAVIVLALTMFVPCTYATFLWNRLRYLWPFATAWFVGLACLARVLGDAAARARFRHAAAVPALLAGAVAGALGSRLDWVLEDIAQSASGIARQQIAIGRWIDENLPADAYVGVNDAGAIAYFGRRRTFDVVGLTTPSEARYWVSGPASRFEHYERLHLGDPSALPTHFAVYPEWLACDPVLGRPLHEAVVRDATILGGQIKRVHEARWESLGSGEAPWTELTRITDAVDVADLESERAHAYALLGAREGEQVVHEDRSPDGALVTDGGRTHRSADRFHARLTGATRAIARLEASEALVVHLRVDGRELGREEVEPGAWVEIAFDLPEEARVAEASVEVAAAGGTFTAFHYWFGSAP